MYFLRLSCVQLTKFTRLPSLYVLVLILCFQIRVVESISTIKSWAFDDSNYPTLFRERKLKKSSSKFLACFDQRRIVILNVFFALSVRSINEIHSTPFFLCVCFDLVFSNTCCRIDFNNQIVGVRRFQLPNVISREEIEKIGLEISAMF